MQGIDFSSIFTDSLKTFGMVLVGAGSIYSLTILLDLEVYRSDSIPLASLSFCSIGFALIALLFVCAPTWLGANALSWFWVFTFAVFWALGSALSGAFSLPTILSYYLLLQSQYSTDNRGFWEKIVSEPYSLAIVAIGLTALLVIAVGFRVGAGLREFFSQSYGFFLLLSAALIGLCSGGVLYFAIQVMSAIAA